MKLKLYHAAAAAAMALSVMLLTACGSPKQADPLPIIKLRTVGSSSEAACQRIGESIERTGPRRKSLDFMVESSNSPPPTIMQNWNANCCLAKNPTFFAIRTPKICSA
ncbi:MAG: hypothetical protein ACLS45_02865 [Subdoligranulum sp.]